MGRPESPLDEGAGPVQEFAAGLRELRAAGGSPTYREMARLTGCGATTLSQAAGGRRMASLSTVLAFVTACGGDTGEWERRFRETVEQEAAVRRAAAGTESPYRGLARFEPGDRELFFGRDVLVGRAVELVGRRRVSVVVGASGAGKSSLLRAGLVPALQQRSPGRAPLAALRIFTPGGQPVRTHAERLVPAPGAGDTVVVVDQFEEVFTLCQDPAERDRFISLLLGALDGGSRLRVVLGVRADFYGRCAEHPDLAAALQDAGLLVGPMGPAELRQAVVRPAAAAGLIVERDLTARIVADVEQEPGGLPLMSHALLEIWRRRRGRVLTLEMYEAVGGIHGAITTTAETLYAALSPARASEARRILLRLVTPGEGAQDTRRPATRAELETGSPATGPVLEQLVAARLVTLGGEQVDLAHEALISAWPRLRSWIEQDRERLRLHRRLTEAARSWDDLGRDPGALYRGAQLALAADAFDQEDREDRGGFHGREMLTAAESAFLTASLTARDHEARAAARGTRRLYALTATLTVLLVLAVTAGLTARSQNRAADRARGLALSRQLAAESGSLLGKNNDTAMLLAVQAYRTSPTTEAKNALAAADALPLRRTITGGNGTVDPLAFSHDGRTLVWADDGSLMRANLTDYRPHSLAAPEILPDSSVGFSPDDRTLLTADGSYEVQQLDLATGKPRNTLPSDGRVISHWISPDGHTLAEIRAPRPSAAPDRPDTLVIHDTVSGATRTTDLAGTVHPIGPDDVRILGLSPDRRTVVTRAKSGDTTLRDTFTGRVRAQLDDIYIPDGPYVRVIFSPDGRFLVAVPPYNDGDDVELWDTATGRRVRILTAAAAESVEPAPVTSLAYSPDGRTLAAGSKDGSLWLWNTVTGYSATTFTGYTSPVTALAFSPDGTTLASGDADGTVRLWDPAGMPGPGTYLSAFPRSLGMPSYLRPAFSPDGRTLITGIGDGGGAELRDTAGTGRSAPLFRWPNPRPPGPGTWTMPRAEVAFTGTTWLLALDNGRTLRIRDTAGHDRTVTASQKQWALSQDGRTLATSDGTTLRLWDTGSGRTRTALKLTTPDNAVIDLTQSPDGRTLAVRTVRGDVRIIQATGNHLRPLSAFRVPAARRGVAAWLVLSPDGRTLATEKSSRGLRLWTTSTGRQRRVIISTAGIGSAPVFSPDSRAVAAGDATGARIWDVATGRIRQTVTTRMFAEMLAFSPDGRVLALSDSIGASLTRTVTPADPTALPARLCTAAGRSLTPKERATYVPGPPAQLVCPAQDRN